MRRFKIRPRRTRHVPGSMNKLETNYMGVLEEMKLCKHIIDYRFEAIKLRLADRTTYTPDFMVIKETHIELHEVKGHWEDDARVKWKVAAEAYPWFEFVAVTQPRKDAWSFEVYKGE